MSETFESNIIAALPHAIMVVGVGMRIEFVNPAAENLLGNSKAHILGKNLVEIPTFGDEWTGLCTRCLSTGETLQLFEKDLEFFHNRITVTACISPLSENSCLITLDKQDSAQKLAAWETKAEVARASGIMAAMLAHEVKNPLAGIRGAAQLLRSEVHAEVQPLTELISRETDRIRNLMDQMEIFAAGSPELSEVNIHEALQYVISIARSSFARNVSFIERYDPSLPAVSANRDLLVQMFLNLVKNAAEAVQQAKEPAITIATYYQSGYRLGSTNLPIAVDIGDNGVGIPEELQENLFEPFFSSKAEGRGLGLAIVAKIAKDLGASVELGQKQERGVKFTIRLAIA